MAECVSLGTGQSSEKRMCPLELDRTMEKVCVPPFRLDGAMEKECVSVGTGQSNEKECVSLRIGKNKNV